MKRLLAGCALALLMVAGPVRAAPPAPTGTLAISSLEAWYGGEVTFSVTTANFKSYQYPLVFVQCFQGTTQVYLRGQDPAAVVVLASDVWALSVGDATCEATLWAYPLPNHGGERIYLLAGPLVFAVDG